MPNRKRKFVKPKTCNISTQTSVCLSDILLKELLQPKVLIEPLRTSRICRYTEKAAYDASQETDDQQSKEQEPSSQRPANISKVPASYTTFVRPITNNEKANSTLLEITRHEDTALSKADEPSGNLILRRKTVRFTKPGPRCSKKAFSNDLEDMRIPLMLGAQNPMNDGELSFRTQLETIAEKSNEELPDPNLPRILSPGLFPEGNDPAGDDREAEAEGSNGNSINQNDDDVVRIETVQKGTARKRIRLQFDGITTILTSKSTSGNAEAEDSLDRSTESRSESHKDDEFKHIKITAKTVYIHNHYYNN